MSKHIQQTHVPSSLPSQLCPGQNLGSGVMGEEKEVADKVWKGLI